MISAFALSIVALQAARMQLIEFASFAARAIARGEAEAQVSNLIFAEDESYSLEIKNVGDLICVDVKMQKEIFWLGNIDLKERQCSRKQGL